jgi:hypothetical protein
MDECGGHDVNMHLIDIDPNKMVMPLRENYRKTLLFLGEVSNNEIEEEELEVINGTNSKG